MEGGDIFDDDDRPKLTWHTSTIRPPDIDERQELGEDVYSLIFVAPVFGRTFMFALYVVFLKLMLFTLLGFDLYSRSQGNFNGKSTLTRVTQFFLIPVAVAMQEDLMAVFARIANVKYDQDILETSPYATPSKFALSFLLRFADGLYSLILNFILLLITDEVLNLFLNFAALGFLQSIDDVAFSVVANGYLGDKMESRADLVRDISLPRRRGDSFTNSLDSVLFFSTCSVMFGIYVFILVNDQGSLSS
ncbi:unnamed protein product [Cylindrotheca closterium]|uniref:Uncharacterized protein n=1 Tax=Cylindrotheca closterium TaxID=2856 RepID=A0AAD2CGH6_9STRA|nr:unnamed protein product [Cylindrotheca closterium]